MIHVFKTTVRSKVQVKRLKRHLDRLLPGARWNFDLQDCDRVLRIDGNAEHVPPVVELLRQEGFACAELE
ncbi:MAG: hypothetical protein EOO15_14465 [Chitinophagaceae bacterium]|nr:MAG: hypothetical protein EOO15_14465 [Chitinophagaceae bacterium]